MSKDINNELMNEEAHDHREDNIMHLIEADTKEDIVHAGMYMLEDLLDNQETVTVGYNHGELVDGLLEDLSEAFKNNEVDAEHIILYNIAVNTNTSYDIVFLDLDSHGHFYWDITDFEVLKKSDIYNADKIVLMTSGSDKQEMIKNLFEGYENSELFASYLFNRDEVYVIADGEALTLLEEEASDEDHHEEA